MVKIKKGDRILMVTNGAFENFYKSQGWKCDKAAKSEELNENTDADLENDDENVNEDADENVDDENGELELLDIPASEMDTKQVAEAAKLLGISKKNKNVEEVRQEIAAEQASK